MTIDGDVDFGNRTAGAVTLTMDSLTINTTFGAVTVTIGDDAKIVAQGCFVP